jgi:hypothetical protein
MKAAQEFNDFTEIIERLQKFVLHAAYGKAMLAAHKLERSLILHIFVETMKSNRSKKISTASHYFDRLNKLTLGSLIREATIKCTFSEEEADEWDNLLYFRNHLTHGISELITDSFFRHGDTEKVAEELDEIESYFHEMQEKLDSSIFEGFGALGMPKHKILEVVNELIKNKKQNLPLLK